MTIERDKTAELRAVATDLDGTLLNGSGQVSERDLTTLKRLGEEGVLRVIATGRNLFSFRKVISVDFPIDYVVFSSGAGSMEWPTQRLLTRETIPGSQVRLICERLIRMNLDFMVHQPIPKNHFFEYHQSSLKNADFERRLQLYRCFHQRLQAQGQQFGPATQIIVIAGNTPSSFDRLQMALAGFKVIRTTSPLDHHSLWIEIFPDQVSKSQGVQKICEWKDISSDQVLAVGNDYNDLDLLKWAGRATVVSNAPEVLKEDFQTVTCHNQHGFSAAVDSVLDSKN